MPGARRGDGFILYESARELKLLGKAGEMRPGKMNPVPRPAPKQQGNRRRVRWPRSDSTGALNYHRIEYFVFGIAADWGAPRCATAARVRRRTKPTSEPAKGGGHKDGRRVYDGDKLSVSIPR